MPDLTVLAAVGFTAFGLVLGVELGWHWAHLLHKPLPRPWRPVLRYLTPGTLWRDVRRCWTTGRWTEGQPLPQGRPPGAPIRSHRNEAQAMLPGACAQVKRLYEQ